jgi:transketolase
MAFLDDAKLKKLDEMAKTIREDIINMLVAAKSGHSAGPLGMADVFTALFFGGILSYDPKNPTWEDRDRVILSNGHICPVLYASMAHAGFFPKEELLTLRKFGSRLQGHPHKEKLPGIETSSGPLGSGLSQAVGMAIAAKMDGKKHQMYCLMGDGELNCGQIWEAAMMAGKHKLDNLTAIIDRNNIQIDGFTEDVMPLEPLADKFTAFGWHVLEVDGHNIEAIVNTLHEAASIWEKPVMIIAHTIPGQGVSFMECDYRWHGKTPKEDEAKKALEEIEKVRTLCGRIIPENF